MKARPWVLTAMAGVAGFAAVALCVALIDSVRLSSCSGGIDGRPSLA